MLNLFISIIHGIEVTKYSKPEVVSKKVLEEK